MRSREALIQAWKERKVREDKAHAKRMEKDRKRDETDRIYILKTLTNLLGIQSDDVDTNDYWFIFPYKGYTISFVNQQDHLCYDINLKTLAGDETKMLYDCRHWLREEDKSLADEIKEEFRYKDDICPDIHDLIEIIKEWCDA